MFYQMYLFIIVTVQCTMYIIKHVLSDVLIYYCDCTMYNVHYKTCFMMFKKK